MKHLIRCPHCGWRTKEHYYESDCIKEKENAHRAKYGSKAHDMAFTSECPACGKDIRGMKND